MFRCVAALEQEPIMTQTSDRATAAELAERIKRVEHVSEAKADRPAGDKPPAYAEFLMPDAPDSVERDAGLTLENWALIGKALEHYATCAKG